MKLKIPKGYERLKVGMKTLRGDKRPWMNGWISITYPGFRVKELVPIIRKIKTGTGIPVETQGRGTAKGLRGAIARPLGDLIKRSKP